MSLQQTTINIPAGHPVRAMAGLAKQIALPGEFAPERFPSFPALERTAVMSFNQPASLTLPAGVETKMMLTRQAGFPLWADTIAGGQVLQYFFTCAGANATYDTQLNVDTLIEAPRFGSSVITALPGRPAVVTGVIQDYFKFPIMGVDMDLGPTQWVYVPRGYTLVLSAGRNDAASFAATVNVRFALDAWSGPGEKKSLEYNATGLVGQNTCVSYFQTLENIWVRPATLGVQFGSMQATTFDWYVGLTVVGGTVLGYVPAATDGGVLNVTPVTTTALTPLVISSEFTNSQIPWQATRTTAAAVLGTNVTQVLNKAGTILAGRVNPDNQDPFKVSSSYVSGLHPAEKAWLPLETGVYSYCPPSTDMANFWDYTSGTVLDYPVYRLDNTSLVNVMFLTAGAATETLAVTASWHLEFRTSSALFQIALSGMTLESFHQAQLALAAAGFFFHNPDHKSVLSKVIGAVKKVAPIVAPALPMPAQMAVRALTTLSGSNPGPRKVNVPQAPMKMPTTTAAASGQNGPRKPAPKSQGKAAKRRGRK